MGFVFGRKDKNPEITQRKNEMKMQEEAHLRDLAISEDRGELQQEYGKSELTRWQQELDSEIIKMAMRLRSYTLHQDGTWVPQTSFGKTIDPLCSEACISELIAMLEPNCSRNLMMSNYSDDFIRQKLKELANAVTLLAISNRKRFGIRMGDLTPIMKIFQGCAEPTFYRAYQGNEKKYLMGVHRYLHTVTDKDEKDKKTNWYGAKV